MTALAGILAGLVALERAGLPAPAFSAWTLDGEDLPTCAGHGERPSAQALPEVLSGASALFGARPSKRGGPPVLPRRHPHSAVLGAWLARWSGRETGACPALIELLEILGREGCPPALPAPWALSARWEPPAQLERPGLKRLSAAGTHRRLALWAWCRDRGVRCVDSVEVAPYPYASLEPLVRAALGATSAPSTRWLAARLDAPGRLVEDLSALLKKASSGWLMRPASPVDRASREVLAQVAARLEGPLFLLEADAAPAGTFSDLRVLTLPEPGDRWWLLQARAVLGGDEAVLDSLSLPGVPLPRPGSSLLPMVPPHRRLEEPPELPGDGPTWAARAWRHAPAREAAGDYPGAAMWRARAHVATGQATLALPELATGKGSDPAEASLLEAKIRERFADLAGTRAALLQIPEGGTSSTSPAEILFLLGQATWLCGGMGEGLRLLEAARASAPDPDVLVLALTGLATARLHLGEASATRDLLAQAEPLLPRCRRHLPGLIWRQRRGLCHAKGGRYLEAAEAYERASDLAREAWEHRFESIADLEMGAALHLAYRFPQARERLELAEQGFATLGLEAPRNSARFDRLLCDIESGRLAEAHASLETSLPRCGPGRDREVERYWLARVLELRGELASSLSLTDRALVEVRRFADPALEAPLLILRARLLLATRDHRRLATALRQCRRLLEAAPDADDRLDAASVLLEASADRRARAVPPDASRAAEACRTAHPGARCRWALARARAGLTVPSEALGEALALAREVFDPALEAEALSEMEARGLLPSLNPQEAERIRRFLLENRIHTPSRRLIAALEGSPPTTQAPPPGTPSALDLLAEALGGAPDLRGAVLAAGASYALLERPGRPPEVSGEPPPRLRQALLSGGAAGEDGTVGEFWVARFEGRGGLRSAFAWPGSGVTETGGTVARLFTALIPPAEIPTSEYATDTPSDPILERLLLGKSPAMATLRRCLREAAGFSFPVLLTGEPGVGKEACARALHGLSPRARRPWIPSNCANLSPTLATSLLFGHRRGAFTGADRDSAGLVESARGGTLFLDEVGELPGETQAQLLRFLQDGSYTPLGEGRPRVAEVRVVAATNRDLESAMSGGSFRADLYHRLNVIRVEIPPLRSRPEDVPLLFSHFLSEAALSEGRGVPEVEEEVWGRLLTWPWPGNVRELQNLARSLLVACSGRGRVAPRDLPRRLAQGVLHRGATGGLRAAREEAERTAVEEALRRCGGNVSAAARALGISRQALTRKLQRRAWLSLRGGSPVPRRGSGPEGGRTLDRGGGFA